MKRFFFRAMMKQSAVLSCHVAGITAVCCSLAWAQQSPRTVEVASKPGGKWTAKETRSLADVLRESALSPDEKLSRFGGLASRKEKATGFFHTTKIDDKWWLVDPEGCLFIHRAR
jgi:hypothetical protein